MCCVILVSSLSTLLIQLCLNCLFTWIIIYIRLYIVNFTQDRNWLLLNWILFCFAVQHINFWIYFLNFCLFVCMLMNAREWSSTTLFISFTYLNCLKMHFSSNCFFLLYKKLTKPNFEEKILLRQVKQAKLVKKMVEGHSLAFINMHASYRNFENKSTNLKASLLKKNIARIAKRCPSKISSVVNMLRLFLLLSLLLPSLLLLSLLLSSLLLPSLILLSLLLPSLLLQSLILVTKF